MYDPAFADGAGLYVEVRTFRGIAHPAERSDGGLCSLRIRIWAKQSLANPPCTPRTTLPALDFRVPGSTLPILFAPVAQLDRASDYGSEGSEFESRRVQMLEQQAVASQTLSEEGLLVRPSLSHFLAIFEGSFMRHDSAIFWLMFVLGSSLSGTLHTWRKEFGGRVTGKHGKGNSVNCSLR